MPELKQPASVTVGTLLKDVQAAPEAALDLELLAGAAGLPRRITNSHPQKTGLALAGFDGYLREGRALILGESEIRYLESLSPPECLAALERVFSHALPCLVITQGFDPPAQLQAAAERFGVPLLRTRAATPDAMARLLSALDSYLAARTLVHGVLMDILGLGLLMVGESGIGKSECALDLVVRGHRLVADDTVEIRRRAASIIVGSCPELTRHHMEVRGLGLINLRDLFGVASTRSSKRVELVVQLERWDPHHEYDRLGLDDAFFELLGLRVPLIRMPVAPGRNLAILVEVAARNQLLKTRGIYAARTLAARLDAQLRTGDTPEQIEDDDDFEI